MRRLRSRSNMTAAVAFVLLGMTIAVFACGGDFSTGPTPNVKGCPITFGAGYPTNGTIRVDKPAICPFNTTGVVNVAYAADATFPVGSTDKQVALVVSDRNGHEQQVFIQTAWGTVGGSGDDLVQTSGNYWAAEGGFDQDANGFYTHGFDNAHNQVRVNGQWREAIATLNYNYGFPGLEVTGPSTNGAYLHYTLDVAVKDVNMVPPVNYDWSVDGAPTGQTGQQFNGQAGDPGTSQSVTVHSVDGNGLEHTEFHTVTACEGTQIDCQ